MCRSEFRKLNERVTRNLFKKCTFKNAGSFSAYNNNLGAMDFLYNHNVFIIYLRLLVRVTSYHLAQIEYETSHSLVN